METPSRGPYMAAKLTTETKEAIALLALHATEEGRGEGDFFALVEKSPLSIPRATLYRWVASLRKGESPFKDEKQTGREKVLSDEQQSILFGRILFFISNVSGIDLETACREAKELFGVEVSKSTMSDYLSNGHMSWKLMGSRPMPAKSSFKDYVFEYYNFLLRLHNEGFFNAHPSKIVCLDFFTDSRRLERVRTFAPRGGKQPKMKRTSVRHTNTVLNGLWLDGIDRTPALAWTHMKAFKKNSAEAKRILQICEQLNVGRERIKFIDSKKQYCKESVDMVEEFYGTYDCWDEVFVLHDKGNSFKRKKYFVEKDFGIERLELFPPICHGELSVNDNHYHALVKNAWRRERSKHGDEVYDLILILHLCDRFQGKYVTDMYNRNFMLKEKSLSLEKTEKLLRGNKRDGDFRQTRFEKYMADYEEFEKEKKDLRPMVVPKKLRTDLGPYWADTAK
jgi:transposase